ncbi:MAG: HAD family hydrolase [Acidobacteriota bacterium]
MRADRTATAAIVRGAAGTSGHVPDGPAFANPLDATRQIRAILFDLDGTLYAQGRMRRLMALELLTLFATRPLSARRRLRALSAYRKAQEALRGSASTALMPRTQLDVAAARAGVPAKELEALVTEWMLERPLKYLPWCRAEGLAPLLSLLEAKRLPLGILSDYPAEAKLRALGVADHFSLVLCATDPEVAALKPSPKGFLAACDRWQLAPHEVLFVGDRAEVDAAGAAAAGMPCVIVGHQARGGAGHPGVLFVPSLERLRCVLAEGC